MPERMRIASRRRPHRAGWIAVVAATVALVAAPALSLSACGVAEPEPASPSTTPRESTPSATPRPTIAPTDPQAQCPDRGGTSAVEDGFPQRLSSLVGADIRTGSHPPCFERVVIEFSGAGDPPGFRVAYQPDPILDSPRGEQVDVAGNATLVVSAGAWMPNPDGGGYDGPRQILPSNVETILELEQLENLEGMTAWAIGLDRERPFTVRWLENPSRLVIDIALD
jgi:hypothetical protein